MKNKLAEKWYVWPTHWAGGSSGMQIDGHNTIWIDSDAGEICRIPTESGRVTEDMFKLAAHIVDLHNQSL